MTVNIYLITHDYDCSYYLNNENLDSEDYNDALSLSSNNSGYNTLFSNSNISDEDETFHQENLILAIMIKVLGKIQGKVFKRGKYFENYFDNKGRLKQIPIYIKEYKLLNILLEEYNFSEEEGKKINKFIKSMLCSNPSNRKSAKDLLTIYN